jgi:hypothetical protein
MLLVIYRPSIRLIVQHLNSFRSTLALRQNKVLFLSYNIVRFSASDPTDPKDFGPPGSVSRTNPLLCKKVGKTLISTGFGLLYDLKTDANVPSKSNKQKNFASVLEGH